MIVITKIDQVDEQELDQLKNEIAEKIGCGVSTVWDIINTKIRFSYKEYFNVA